LLYENIRTLGFPFDFMKKAIILIISFLVFACIKQTYAQTAQNFSYANFEQQVLSYNPKQQVEVTKEKFDHATMILSETRKAVKNNPGNFNLADYFNILVAFLNLKETKENLSVAFNKFETAPGSCEYILAFEKDFRDKPIFEPIREKYLAALAKCNGNKSDVVKQTTSAQYAQDNHLDLQLVEAMELINTRDQQYRGQQSLNQKQQQLDKANQLAIDSLYSKYKKYIGLSLVGERYKHTMWIVIQHSNVTMMEKYLPIIHQAIKQQQLDEANLKMMIDRYYGLKFGYQFFGTQSESFRFKTANEAQRKELMEKYGIK